nr:MAG: replication associated protein [Cressdnaviricota sp.]
MARSRNFCFTLNNYTNEQRESMCAIECVYLVIGQETGESGTPHLQGYISFVNAKTLSALKKLQANCHWEIARGTPLEASAYCKKDDLDFFEKGVLPLSQVQKGDKEKERWTSAFAAVEANQLDLVPPDILCMHLKKIEYAVDRVRASKRKLVELEDWQHEWRYGETGSGKSKTARDENSGAYIKNPNNVWWDGYSGEDVVIIDDFDKYQIKQGGDMKRWLDVYPFQAESKGRQELIRPKKIIVTSNYHPSEIWSDEQTLGPIMRRVKVIHHKAWAR